MNTCSNFLFSKQILLITCFFTGNIILSQVNTETLRRENLDEGLHFVFGGNVGYVEGNSSVFQNRSDLRVDYVKPWGKLFGVVNYKVNTKDRKLFINKGFSHGRLVKPFNQTKSGEFFLQHEFNEFIQLEGRRLLGGGIRFVLKDQMDKSEEESKIFVATGTGLMWEIENISTGEDGTQGDPIHDDLASLIRSTNYLVFNWYPSEQFGLSTTTYYQFDTSRFRDFRILNRIILEMKVTKRLGVTLDFNLRYDSEPPGLIKGTDIDLYNGVSYRF